MPVPSGQAGLHCGLIRNKTAPPTPGPPAPPTPPIVPAPPGAKNVLLIVSDDMRPDLPMYGNAIMRAPNLQRIADNGVTFNQAHVQISYCCPSRNSFMSGRRPDTTQVWNFLSTFREAGSTPAQQNRVLAFKDLPQWFKEHGYFSTGTGKTWHNGVGYNPDADWTDLSQFPYKFGWPGKYVDINNTDVTIERIKYAAKLQEPFFIAHGYIRPHLPWDYPPAIKDTFYPEYKNGSKVVPAARNPVYPEGTTPIAWHQCAEMAVPSLEVGFPESEVSSHRLEYFNAITFVDQQIGRLLDTLESSGVANDTAILFLGMRIRARSELLRAYICAVRTHMLNVTILCHPL